MDRDASHIYDQIQYGKLWFHAEKRLTKAWDESTARAAHADRRPYAALLIKNAKAHCVVETNNDYIGVGFLDAVLREYLTYQFQELEPGRLFLTMATHRHFEGDTDRVTDGTSYVFKPDGRVTIEHEDFNTRMLTTKESCADVNSNWEAYPEFGAYHSLARENR